MAQTRRALESPIGAQAALQNDDVLDLELLKEFGLDDVALQLAQEMQVQSEAQAPGTDTTGNDATNVPN